MTEPKWTLKMADRTPKLVLKDTTTIMWTVACWIPGVTIRAFR